MATRSAWTAPLLTILGLCWTNAASGEGLVLVLNKESGAFSSQKQAGTLARNFGPGGTPLGLEDERDDGRPGASDLAIPGPRVPRPEVDRAIEEVALRYARDPALRRAGLSMTEWLGFFRANIEIESGYDPRAVSHMGAIGLGQLMPATAAKLGVDPRDMQENLDGSARYMLMLLDRFGSKELALAGYNAGPAAVAKHGGIPPYPETKGHVRKVMAAFHRLRLATAE